MAAEIELKLSLRSPATLLRHPALATAQSKSRQRLRNIYFDTPDMALLARGVALRLRRKGRQWLQTVKCAGVGLAGLSHRPEWETAYAGQFDFSGIDEAKLRRWLAKPALAAQLVPVFETRFTRTAWQFASRGTRIEMALDRGEIIAGQRREPICEVELELKKGSSERLFGLALQFAQSVALLPLAASKAERGYRLARQSAFSVAKRKARSDWRREFSSFVDQLALLQPGGEAAFLKMLQAALDRPAFGQMWLRLSALAAGAHGLS